MSRTIPRAVVVTCLAIAVTVCLPSFAHAQIMVFQKLQGKVVSVSNGVIQWTDASKAEMYAIYAEPTSIKVTGEAEPSFLRPGMYVRFGAEITKRGKIVDDIEELTIFTPGDGYTIGVFEDGPVNPKDSASKYFVAGQIDSYKNGLFTIETGEDSFKVKLSDDVKIKIETHDLSIAKADDEITLTGGGEDKTKIIATEITIELAEPLKGEEKKAKRTAKSRRAAKTDSDDERPVDDRPDDEPQIADPAFVPDPDFE
jgi:hypothetical protein